MHILPAEKKVQLSKFVIKYKSLYVIPVIVDTLKTLECKMQKSD